MLVLTRKKGETICIGNNIEVQVLEIRQGQVRLGFEAPRDVDIVRSEVVGRRRGDGEAEPEEEEADHGVV